MHADVPAVTDVRSLINDPRNLADGEKRELAALSFAELSRPEQLDLVRSVPVESRFDVLTLAEDCTPLVHEMTPQEIYAIVSDKELQHSGSIAAAASPKQFVGILDIACWRGERLAGEQSVEWLTWLSELPDELFVERVRELDTSFLASILGPHMKVVSAVNPFDPQPSADGGFLAYQGSIYSTPGAFEFDDVEVELLVKRIYEAAYDIYEDMVQRTFADPWMGIGTKPKGVRTQRSEAAFLRARRMQQAGLPDDIEARVRLLQPIEVDLPRGRGPESFRGMLAPLDPSPITERMGAFSGGEETIAKWQESLAWVASQLVVARGGDPGKSSDLRRALKTSQAFISVALDALSDGCAPWAAVIASTWDWSDLFRAGWSMAAPVRERAVSIGEDLILRGERKLWCAGLFEKPITVYDVVLRDYRLPNRASDIQRLARMLSM